MLKPCYINPANSYRYYSDVEIASIIKIIELKNYDFSLDEIKAFISLQDKEGELEFYRSKVNLLNVKQKETAEMISKLEKKLSDSERKIEMNDKSILIIHSMTKLIPVLKQILEREGYPLIYTTENGLTGIEIYEEHRPDLVILDINLTGLNGIDTLKKLKEIDDKVRVIICTEEDHHLVVKTCADIGVCGYLVAPFMVEMLMLNIKSAFRET